MICHDSLANFYVTNHTLHKNWGYSWDILENMIPYEREMIVNLILNEIKEKNNEVTDAQKDWINNPARERFEDG